MAQVPPPGADYLRIKMRTNDLEPKGGNAAVR